MNGIVTAQLSTEELELIISLQGIYASEGNFPSLTKKITMSEKTFYIKKRSFLCKFLVVCFLAG